MNESLGVIQGRVPEDEIDAGEWASSLSRSCGVEEDWFVPEESIECTDVLDGRRSNASTVLASSDVRLLWGPRSIAAVCLASPATPGAAPLADASRVSSLDVMVRRGKDKGDGGKGG